MVAIILASASTSRLRLLESAGIVPKVIVSGVDEDAPEFESLTPAELVIALAILKAHTIKNLAPSNSLIIGCDSTFEFQGRSLGKPYTKENAITRCKELSGNYGFLHTGHCLLDLRQEIELSERSTSKVYFAQMSDAEITDYVESKEPLNVAGGFTLDGLSAPFITKIEGDPSGIIGLSLPLLRKMIISIGYTWPELKNKY